MKLPEDWHKNVRQYDYDFFQKKKKKNQYLYADKCM